MTVSTEHQPLAAPELARYLGAECEYESRDRNSFLNGDYTEWKRTVGQVDVHLLWNMIPAGFVRNVRPVLKRLGSITPEQAREVMNIAGLNPEDEEVVASDTANGIVIFAGRNCLFIYESGHMSAMRFAIQLTFNAVAVVDYLRGQGYDMDSLLQRGLALEYV